MEVDVAWLDGTVIPVTGNSFATPVITGYVALILSKHPGLTPFQIKTVLHATAENAVVDAQDAEQTQGRWSPGEASVVNALPRLEHECRAHRCTWSCRRAMLLPCHASFPPAGYILVHRCRGLDEAVTRAGCGGLASALAEHRRRIRQACAAFGGIEVDTHGGAFFMAFPDAQAATSTAQTLTNLLAPGPIRVRVGLHSGTPLTTDEGYVGEDVHLAARIAAAAHGGQIALSGATRTLQVPPSGHVVHHA